ncbi:MAG: heparinase II/III family protein, partial [Phycisphaerae bacterium]|nr:heparinase II/III family protein [Phycisphaerae bacterium]
GSAFRTWFDKAGVLICRPGGAAGCRMGVAAKGGHNAEHHNHNDVGSYVVVVGDRAVLVDPGSEVYTSRTFSNKRYESKVLNSYGHPVPMVAGELQKSGRSATGRVVKTSFGDAEDVLVLDLSSAYGVKGLKGLTRTFRYSRAGAGSLTIVDEVELAGPGRFGTALVTLGEWKRAGPNVLEIKDGAESVRVEIETGGAAFDVVAEEIKEDVRTKKLPTRIGINLKDAVSKARVAVTVRAGAAAAR